MTRIIRATIDDAELLAHVARESFLQSHGHSADPETVNAYVNDKFSLSAMQKELADPKNIYAIIYSDDQPAGYSKVVFDASHPAIEAKNVTKLDRIYLLENFIHHKLGAELLQFNIGLSKNHNQAGMWLFVWKENPRAYMFYLRAGFEVIGSYDFKLSPTHANPNHHMLLMY
jgi:diamine N-acetyltransferase